MPIVSQRSGAPTWVELIKTACRLSHNAAFRAGLLAIFGDDAAVLAVYGYWVTFCAAFEAMMAADDQPGEIDATTGEAQDRPGI